MRKQTLGKLSHIVAGILLTTAFLFGQTARAAQSQNSNPDSNSKPGAQASTQAAAQLPQKIQEAPPAASAQPGEEQSVTAPKAGPEQSAPGGQHEGIKVHGHWIIEVRNPDGTVVTHREFENSLAAGGYPLGYFLSRQTTVGLWVVLLGSGNGGQVCPGSTTNGECELVEAADPSTGSGVFNTLVPSFTNTGTNQIFVLNGSYVAPAGGVIVTVSTIVASCPVAGVVCAPGTSGNETGAYGQLFTQTGLPSAIGVSAGQTVAVTVNISFS